MTVCKWLDLGLTKLRCKIFQNFSTWIEMKAYLILSLTSIFLPANMFPSSLNTGQLLISHVNISQGPPLSIPATAFLPPSHVAPRIHPNPSQMFLTGLQTWPPPVHRPIWKCVLPRTTNWTESLPSEFHLASSVCSLSLAFYPRRFIPCSFETA